MKSSGSYVKQATSLVVALSCVALSSIGGADSIEKARNIADQELFFAPVPKAVCGPGDSPELALQGQVPGLYIQTDGSPTGGNGGVPTILIRGVNTLGNTNPLYIIDGVPTTRYEDFANLNTNAIASIQVLKDASAASIYGSRASNGVIIVTTKDGSASGDKVRIQFNTSLTSQNEKPWQEKVLNSYDRGATLWRAAVNDKTNPNNLVSQIYTYDWNGDYANPVLNKVNIAPYVGGDKTEPVGNTNWQDALYKKALVTSNDLSISAGANPFLSASRLDARRMAGPARARSEWHRRCRETGNAEKSGDDTGEHCEGWLWVHQSMHIGDFKANPSR